MFLLFLKFDFFRKFFFWGGGTDAWFFPIPLLRPWYYYGARITYWFPCEANALFYNKRMRCGDPFYTRIFHPPKY
jgi:hypothetical protein